MDHRERFLGLTAILLLCCAPASAQATPDLSLQQAEQIALQNHPQLRAAQFFAQAAQEVTTQARSAYYPVAYGSLTGVEADHGSRIAAGGLNNPVIFNRYANGLTVGQLVTDFGRTYNLVASSRLRANAAQADVQLTRADILLRVDRAFFSALRAQAVLRVAQQTVAQRQLIADQVTALTKSKLKADLDLSFANVNLYAAQLLLAKAKNDVRASAAELDAALGFSDMREFSLFDDAAALIPPPPLPDALVGALRDRPDLAEERLNVDAAKRFEKAERDLWFPTIAVLGTAGLTPYRQPGIGDHYAAAGFNVNIPIFNGRLFSARRAEAEYRAKAEDQRLKDLIDRATRDVRIAWLNADTAFQNLELTARLLEQAQKALDLSQARYKLGLGSIVELSQAQLNETEAEIQQKTAKYEYQADLAILNYEVGKLR